MTPSGQRSPRGQRHSRQPSLPKLETQNAPNNRFSYTMTPAQAQNATFDGPEFERPETIFDDESPITEHNYQSPEPLPHPPSAPLPALPPQAYQAANRNAAPLPPLPPEAYQVARPKTPPQSTKRTSTYELPASNTSPQQAQPMSSYIPSYDNSRKAAYEGLGLSTSPPLQEVHPALREATNDSQTAFAYQPPRIPLSPVSHSSHTHTQSYSSIAPSSFTPSTIKSGPYGLDQKKTAPPPPLDFYSPYDNPQTPRTASIPAYTPGSPLGPNASNFNLRHQPPPSNLPLPESTSITWHSSTLSPSSSCLSSLFCPCIIYGRVQHRLSQRSKKAEPTDLLGYSAVNGQCGIMALACGFQGILATIQRTRVRRAYNIEGDILGDCMRGCCCCCCTIGLSESEMVQREEERRKLAGTTNTSGYVNTGRLTYMPPPR